MSLLLKFERRLEAVVEGLFVRWARDRVHPVEIGRRLLREMESGAVAGVHGTVLPNDFRVFLHPKDFAPYESFAPSLTAELAELLTAGAAELNARPAGPVRVSVEPRDAITPGEIYVEARLAPQAEQGPPSSGHAGDATTPAAQGASDTRVYRGPSPGPRLRVLAGPAGTAGREFLFDRPAVAIGRRADQDIVLDDPSVSRAHARLHVTTGEVAVEDLGSTNGTAVNGRPLRRGRVPVRDGDRIKIGSVLLEYRAGP